MHGYNKNPAFGAQHRLIVAEFVSDSGAGCLDFVSPAVNKMREAASVLVIGVYGDPVIGCRELILQVLRLIEITGIIPRSPTVERMNTDRAKKYGTTDPSTGWRGNDSGVCHCAFPDSGST